MAGYVCMDLDTYRNAYFSQSIRRHSSRPEKRSRRLRHSLESTSAPGSDPVVNHWLEVGPGAIGTLTRIVLSDPATDVVAIEANVGAAHTLRSRPDMRQFLKQGRLKVSCTHTFGGSQI